MGNKMGFASSIVVLLLAGHSFCYHTGAPDQACSSMVPGHGLAPKTGQSPFRVIMPKWNFKSGEPIQLTLTAPQSGPPFMGFLIQIHAKGGSDPVGQFKSDSDPDLAQPVSCLGKPNSAMTHKMNDKKTQVKLEWTPPGPGEYEPIVTFVEKIDTFWVREKPAQAIKISGSSSDESLNVSDRDISGGGPTTTKPPSRGGAASALFAVYWNPVLVFSVAILFSFINLKRFF